MNVYAECHVVNPTPLFPLRTQLFFYSFYFPSLPFTSLAMEGR